MSSLELIIGVSDEYLPILKPACFLFNKFWSADKEVKVVGFREPDFELPKNFRFMSLGVQRGPKYWAKDINSICDLVDAEHFIFVVENDLLIKPVNFEVLGEIQKMIVDDNSIARADLTTSSSIHSPGRVIKNYELFNIFELPQNAKWRMALGHYSIWRKSYLSKYLNSYPLMDPWQFEMQACKDARNDGAKIIASSGQYAVHFIDSVHKHRGNKLIDLRGVGGRSSFNLGVDDEIIVEMIERKIIKPKDDFFETIP